MGNQLVSYIENLKKMRIMIDCKLVYFIACCGSCEFNWMINVCGGLIAKKWLVWFLWIEFDRMLDNYFIVMNLEIFKEFKNDQQSLWLGENIFMCEL